MTSYFPININELIGSREFLSLRYLIFIEASSLQNIARKHQGKSVTSYFLMNSNDLGAIALSSLV